MGNVFECGRLVPELSLVFQKLYIRTKQMVSIFVLIYFGRIFTWTYNQNKRYNISDCWYRDMLNFDFLSMGLGLTFPPHLCAWFFKKGISHIIFNWPKFIVWLPLLLEILGNMCVAVTFCPACDILKFEISHSFLIKPFSTKLKCQDKNVNISRTKRVFNMK